MSTTPLSSSGEHAWQGLRTHLEWASGFWLGWIFTDHPPSGRELFARSAAFLDECGRKAELCQPHRPDELTSDVTNWLFGEATQVDGCVAIAVVHLDETWSAAWEQFLLRLNMRRDWLRQHIRGGLLLIAPMTVKAQSRAIAPDLWSIRSLVFDVLPPSAIDALPDERRGLIDDESEAASTPTLALQGVAAAVAAGQIDAEVNARLRAAQVLVAAGRRDEGLAQAICALQIAPAYIRPRALAVLGHLESHGGEPAAAETHFSEAYDLDPGAFSIRDLHAFSALLLERGKLDRALVVAQDALQRARHEGESGNPLALQDEFLSVSRIGDIQRAMGMWRAAADSFEAALILCRRYRSVVGNTARALRYEALCYSNIGYVLWTLGEWPTAANAFEESLALLHRVRVIVGDTPGALRDEYVVLVQVSYVRQGLGDLVAATTAVESALALLPRIRESTGETLELLRDESLALNSLGEIYRNRYDLAAAVDVFTRSAELCRRIRVIRGDVPETLRDEAIAHHRIGILRGAMAVWEDAAVQLENSLNLLRRARVLEGDTPQLLGDTAVCLQRLASAYEHLHRPADARVLLVEAEALLDNVSIRAPTPRVLEMLAETRERLAHAPSPDLSEST